MKHFIIKAAGEDLVTVENVPLMTTGKFDLFGGGEQVFTLEDLEAAANAPVKDDSVKLPRQGVGHISVLDDGEPALGTYQNLRVKATGTDRHTLYGDVHGVPRWFAKILPSAYPNRSVEGERNYVSDNGITHKLAITAVKCLGVVMPGISTLDDLRHMYGSEVPEGTHILASYIDPKNKVIIANMADDELDVQEGTVRQVDPKALRKQLGLAETATDAEVDTTLAALKATSDQVVADKAKADQDKADADKAAADKAAADKAAADAAALALANLPSGTVLVDKEQFEELKIAAGRANTLFAAHEILERDTEINKAVSEGRFGKARVEHFQNMWKADKEGCRAIMASLAPGLVPVAEIGSSSDGDETQDVAVYPEEFLSTSQRAVVAAAKAGKSHLELVPGEILTDKVG